MQTPECQPGQQQRQGHCWHPTQFRRIGLLECDKNPSLSLLASWADGLSMIKARHLVMAERIIGSLNNARPAGPCIRSAALTAWALRVSKSRPGKRLQMASAHHPESLRTQSQAGSSTGGSTKRLPGWRDTTETTR